MRRTEITDFGLVSFRASMLYHAKWVLDNTKPFQIHTSSPRFSLSLVNVATLYFFVKVLTLWSKEFSCPTFFMLFAVWVVSDQHFQQVVPFALAPLQICILTPPLDKLQCRPGYKPLACGLFRYGRWYLLPTIYLKWITSFPKHIHHRRVDSADRKAESQDVLMPCLRVVGHYYQHVEVPTLEWDNQLGFGRDSEFATGNHNTTSYCVGAGKRRVFIPDISVRFRDCWERGILRRMRGVDWNKLITVWKAEKCPPLLRRLGVWREEKSCPVPCWSMARLSHMKASCSSPSVLSVP